MAACESGWTDGLHWLAKYELGWTDGLHWLDEREVGVNEYDASWMVNKVGGQVIAKLAGWVNGSHDFQLDHQRIPNGHNIGHWMIQSRSSRLGRQTPQLSVLWLMPNKSARVRGKEICKGGHQLTIRSKFSQTWATALFLFLCGLVTSSEEPVDKDSWETYGLDEVTGIVNAVVTVVFETDVVVTMMICLPNEISLLFTGYLMR